MFKNGIETIVDKHGDEYLVHYRGRPLNVYHVTLTDKTHPDYEHIGMAQVSLSSPVVSSVHVWKKYARRGIATALYDLIEKHIGQKLVPNNYPTADASAFWEARNSRDK